uniref:Uncharacterized protein n=1 Tax=Favella ehrenbergii TaxID=182087 RepID=A0A7S3I7Y9_9SPIT|mmetsp:Transcript_42041/g.55401  ORF Transcript_42041/g.55401 Transcript_42041/m.55401 type:complete len:149 (+) Transcript_42041:686-1132(+)
MTRIRLRAMMSLLTEKFYRNTWHSLEGYGSFSQSKAQLLERLPLPRRKKWWEKLAEHQHDHFYQEAVEMLPTVPAKYLETYTLIIEHQMMQAILKIQRYVKMRGLKQWLLVQSPDNTGWQTKIFVDVYPVDHEGAHEGRDIQEQCRIF